MRRQYLIAVLAFAVGCSSLAQPQLQKIPEHSATVPTPRHEGWRQFQQRMHRIAIRNPVDLLFLGDSITYGWTSVPEIWDENYSQLNAANLGIGGDRTEQILWRIDHGALDGMGPRLVVLQVGTNNTVEKYGNAANSPQEIAEGVAAIVQRIRAKLPETNILVLGIFPRGRRPQHRLRRAIADANKILAKMMAQQPAISYLDIGSHFVEDDGTISSEVMADGLHLTPRGYRIWAEAIHSVVTELMGETG